MTKVVHLTSVHPPFDIRIFYKECSSLANAGYDVHLIVPHDQNEAVNGVCMHALRKPLNRISRMTYTVWQMYRKAIELDGDIYHLHDPELLPVGYWLSKSGKIVIFDVHENIGKQILTRERLPIRKLFSKIYKCLEYIVVKGNMRLVIAEHSYETWYSSLDQNCITILNFPLVRSSHTLPYAAREDAIGYVGVLWRFRGLDQVLDALAILRQRGLRPKFHCVGEFSSRDYECQSIRRVKELGIADQVVFYGRLNNPEALEIIQRCKVGVSVSHPIPNYLESYSTKIFEYMEIGIPFLASDFPINRQINAISGECGILVNPLDPVAISDSLEYLLTNPKEAAEMGERGRKAVENHFNWRYEEKKLLELYESFSESGNSI